MEERIHCPNCGSTDWVCFEEHNESFEDESGELYEAPVGYLKCSDCQETYIHTDTTDKHIGDYPYDDSGF